MSVRVVEYRIMLRVSFVMGVVLAGCGGPSASERRTIDLFDRVAALMVRYDAAYAERNEAALVSVSGELRRIAGPNVPVLVEQLETGDLRRQAYAAFGLGFSGSAPAVAPLVAKTSHPEAAVRALAIASLGLLGFREVPLDPFKKLLDDPSAHVRTAALLGLRPLLPEGDDRGMLDLIHARLSDPDLGVRNEALIVLRKPRSPKSVDPIVKGPVKDPEALVRAQAASTLGSIGTPAKPVTPHLIEMLKDDQSKVVESAWDALNRIHGKDFDRSYHTWRDWYEDEQRHHYLCLDHREEKPGDEPGDCPRCSKKLERMVREPLVKRVEATAGLLACPDHPEIRTTSPSNCGKVGCGKALLPRKPDPVTYVCPEHPEILTSSPAGCGKAGCGKPLVPRKPDAVTYVCPDHPEVLTSTPATCGKPGCGKPLVPKPQ